MSAHWCESCGLLDDRPGTCRACRRVLRPGPSLAHIYACPNCGLEFGRAPQACPVCQGPDLRRPRTSPAGEPLAALGALPLPVQRAARRALLGPSVIGAVALAAVGFLTEVILRAPAGPPAPALAAAREVEAAAPAAAPPPAWPEQAERFNRRGVELARAGDLDGAILQFTHAIVADPGHYKSHNNLGVLYKRKGFLRQAISAYKAASQLRPQNPVPYKNLAILYEETAAGDEALAHYARYLELAPAAADAAAVRARMARLRRLGGEKAQEPRPEHPVPPTAAAPAAAQAGAG